MCLCSFLDLKVIEVPPMGYVAKKYYFFSSLGKKTTLISDVVKNLKSVSFVNSNGYLIFLRTKGHNTPYLHFFLVIEEAGYLQRDKKWTFVSPLSSLIISFIIPRESDRTITKKYSLIFTLRI